MYRWLVMPGVFLAAVLVAPLANAQGFSALVSPPAVHRTFTRPGVTFSKRTVPAASVTALSRPPRKSPSG